MHTSKVLWVFAIVLVGTVVQCQRPRPRPRPGGRPALRDSMLASMVRSNMNGARDMLGNVVRGLARTLDPEGSRAGPGRVRVRQQSQRGGGQRQRGGGAPQGRIAITQEEYDYLNNFDYDDDLSFDYYDYSASGETNNDFLEEPVPVALNLPVRNKNKNKNNLRNPGRWPIRQLIPNTPGPKQFNKPQIINKIIERSGFDGPYYPYETFVGKSLW